MRIKTNNFTNGPFEGNETERNESELQFFSPELIEFQED